MCFEQAIYPCIFYTRLLYLFVIPFWLILVLGAPPMYTPLNLPTTIQKDSKVPHRLPRGSKTFCGGYLPLLTSLRVMNNQFDFDSVNILTHRNSLRKLFNFISGRAKDSFRIDVQIIRDTLVLVRREQNWNKVLFGQTVGYGRSFENAFTTPVKGLEQSTAYHRVIQYKLGHLHCVVQFEVDASLSSSNDSADSNDKKALSPTKDAESLNAALENLSIKPTTSQSKIGSKTSLKVENCGSEVPVTELAELKSGKKFKKEKNSKDKFAQLWFGRTPFLITGEYTGKNDEFDSVSVQRAVDNFAGWEAKHQADLRKLVALLEELKRVAMRAKGTRFFVACDKKVKPLQLQIYKDQSRGPCAIPKEFVEMFWRDHKA